jgi:4-oxalomesaconate tautomerase
MSAALPLYAWSTGLVPVDDHGRFPPIEINNTNTAKTIQGTQELREGRPVATEIPGVLGHYPRVILSLADPVGAKTGRMLPTGSASDTIEGVQVSCVDVAVPMVILRATDVGKTGLESPQQLDADKALMQRLRAIWVEAGLRMQLRRRDGSLMTAAELAASETVPKVCLVARSGNDASIVARYFTPQEAHNSMAVSGACCLAAACLIPGSVAAALVDRDSLRTGEGTYEVAIDNPAGVLRARIEADIAGDDIVIRQAAYERSAQILAQGTMPLYQASPKLAEFLWSRDARRA